MANRSKTSCTMIRTEQFNDSEILRRKSLRKTKKGKKGKRNTPHPMKGKEGDLLGLGADAWKIDFSKNESLASVVENVSQKLKRENFIKIEEDVVQNEEFAQVLEFN
mmetsp:Transcript_19059/g.16894  ORF Transcript_19059/g.16894 Transcript_19059/m.16894 type:complete len:107 (-) Transcript_19059:3-323(-)